MPAPAPPMPLAAPALLPEKLLLNCIFQLAGERSCRRLRPDAWRRALSSCAAAAPLVSSLSQRCCSKGAAELKLPSSMWSFDGTDCQTAGIAHAAELSARTASAHETLHSGQLLRATLLLLLLLLRQPSSIKRCIMIHQLPSPPRLPCAKSRRHRK